MVDRILGDFLKRGQRAQQAADKLAAHGLPPLSAEALQQAAIRAGSTPAEADNREWIDALARANEQADEARRHWAAARELGSPDLAALMLAQYMAALERVSKTALAMLDALEARRLAE